MNIYYVYAYLRKKDNTPYYIGKGCKRRAYARHSGITVPKDKTKIVFLETNLTELGAFALERRMIRWYGRKDIGTGILLNKSDGGESGPGLSKGIIISDYHKEKLSKAKKGKTWEEIFGEDGAARRKEKASLPKGPMSPDTKEKISKVKKLSGWKPVWSIDSRIKLSQTNKGRIISEEQKIKLKEASKIMKECPQCGSKGKGPSMQRWHFKHCRVK